MELEQLEDGGIGATLGAAFPAPTHVRLYWDGEGEPVRFYIDDPHGGVQALPLFTTVDELQTLADAARRLEVEGDA